MMKIATIKKRADFLLAAQSGFKFVKPMVIVQLRKHGDTEAIRVGFTATKKLGNAVVRNRVKRRMRAAAAKLVPELGLPGCDYVFIGREKLCTSKFSELINEMKYCLQRLAAQMS